MNKNSERKSPDSERAEGHQREGRNRASNAPKFRTDRSHYAAAFERWITKQYPNRSDIKVANIDIPVSTGFSNETVLFDISYTENRHEQTERLVARIEPSDGALFPAQSNQCGISVEVQYRAMQTVARHCQAPIPKLLGYEGDPTIIGQPFFLMGFTEGRVPADHPRYSQEGFLVDEASPQQRHRLVASGLQAMAEIHSIDWQAAELDWLDPSGAGKPNTQLQLDLYRAAVSRELAGREHHVFDAALDWLTNNDPHDDRIGLSWGDSRLGNILWQDYRPAAILDWEACSLSPTEADVGWWLMFDRMSFDDVGATRMEGFPNREEMIALYEHASGRQVRAPHYWEVFATMRFCAIFIGLADRMVNSGLIAAEKNPAVNNMVTEALARLLEIPNPTPSNF